MLRLRFLCSTLFLLTALFPTVSPAQWNPLNPVQSVRKDAEGVTLFLEKGALGLQVSTDAMVRVLFSPQREFPKVADYVVIKSEWPATPFEVTETNDAVTLNTTKLRIVVTKKDS